MAYVEIESTQTDDGSPINENLMDSLRRRSTYIPIGTVIWQHNFNGLLAAPEGYMKADGGICNEANYNTLHGAGQWAAEIGTSALDGKYLPNLVGKYPVGSATTTQTGASAITAVGNASHQVDIQHNHSHDHSVTNQAHNHQWYKKTSTGGSSYKSQSYGSAGTVEDVTADSNVDTSYIAVNTGGNMIGNTSLYTADETANGGTNTDATNAGSTTQSVQPESIELIPFIKIV